MVSGSMVVEKSDEAEQTPDRFLSSQLLIRSEPSYSPVTVKASFDAHRAAAVRSLGAASAWLRLRLIYCCAFPPQRATQWEASVLPQDEKN